MKSNLVKANKIVERATMVFGDAIAEIEKANTLLATGIEKDLEKIRNNENVIRENERSKEETKKDILAKQEQIKKNDKVIEQLASFVARQE